MQNYTDVMTEYQDETIDNLKSIGWTMDGREPMHAPGKGKLIGHRYIMKNSSGMRCLVYPDNVYHLGKH